MRGIVIFLFSLLLVHQSIFVFVCGIVDRVTPSGPNEDHVLWEDNSDSVNELKHNWTQTQDNNGGGALSLVHQRSYNATDNNMIDTSVKILSRPKREIISAFIISFLTGAAVSAGAVSLTEFYRAKASDECAVTIVYEKSISGSLNMNFKSDFDNNWNLEELYTYGQASSSGVDVTKEKVTGGRLKLIQIYPSGYVCIRAIIFSCGSELNRLNTERSVILDVATVKKAWTNRGHQLSDLSSDGDRCIIWSNVKKPYGFITAIDVYPNAFTDCENANENCISKHIEVFVNLDPNRPTTNRPPTNPPTTNRPTTNPSLTKLKPGMISLKSKRNGKFVCADNQGKSPLIANRDKVGGDWEFFFLIFNSDGTVSLKAKANNKYVMASNYGSGPLIAGSDQIQSWEKFYLKQYEDGTVSFKASINGKYVVSEDQGLKANRDSAGQWEVFYINYHQ